MRVRFAHFNDNRTTQVEKGRGSISIKIEFVREKRGNLQSVEGTIDLMSERGKEIERERERRGKEGRKRSVETLVTELTGESLESRHGPCFRVSVFPCFHEKSYKPAGKRSCYRCSTLDNEQLRDARRQSVIRSLEFSAPASFLNLRQLRGDPLLSSRHALFSQRFGFMMNPYPGGPIFNSPRSFFQAFIDLISTELPPLK